MKTFLLAAAGLSAFAAAAPAAAQYYPQPNYGYNQPYGYGYNDQQGLVRSYLVRADQLRQRVERLDSRDRISEREAARLRAAALDLQRRTRAYAQNGLNNRERYELDQRFAQLQQALRRERFDDNNRWGGDRYDDDRYGRYGRYDGARYPDGRLVNDRDRDGVDDSVDHWIDLNGDGRDDYGRRY